MKEAVYSVISMTPVLSCILAGMLMAGCATPKRDGYDPDIKAAAESAQVALQRGELDRADALYSKALDRARLTDNRNEVVRNTYNLALCRMSAGQLGDARNLLVQARSLTTGRGVVASRILLAEAEVARLAGAGPVSEQLARQAMAAGADRDGQVQAWLLQGEAWLLAGQLQSSRDCYDAAVKASSKATPAAVRARLEGLAAGLVQARVLTGSVAVLQLSRAEWLKKAGQFSEMVQALQAAATAFELESKWAEAFDCRIRVAQSLQAAGNVKLARIEAGKADELAGRTGNVNSKSLAASLLTELK